MTFPFSPSLPSLTSYRFFHLSFIPYIFFRLYPFSLGHHYSFTLRPYSDIRLPCRMNVCLSRYRKEQIQFSKSFLSLLPHYLSTFIYIYIRTHLFICVIAIYHIFISLYLASSFGRLLFLCSPTCFVLVYH